MAVFNEVRISDDKTSINISLGALNGTSAFSIKLLLGTENINTSKTTVTSGESFILTDVEDIENNIFKLTIIDNAIEHTAIVGDLTAITNHIMIKGSENIRTNDNDTTINTFHIYIEALIIALSHKMYDRAETIYKYISENYEFVDTGDTLKTIGLYTSSDNIQRYRW